MKYHLVLLASLGLSIEAFSQSTLYQTGSQPVIDEQFELFDKQLFSAALLDYQKDNPFDFSAEQDRSRALLTAKSALNLEAPNGPGLMKAYILDNGNHPSVNTAGLYLGDHFFYKRNYKEAAEAFSLVNTDQLDNSAKADVLFKQGYAFFLDNNYGKAAPYFDQSKVLGEPISYDAYYYSGYIALESGATQKAIADLQAAGRSQFYSTKVPYLLAALYYQQGSYEELISYAEPKLAESGNLDRREMINLYLAEAYFAKKDFAKAAENYDAFVNARKGELTREQVYKGGIAQFELGNFPRASDYLKVSASSNDELGQASSYYLGHAYLKQDNFQFASTSFKAAADAAYNKEIQEEALFNYAKSNLQKGSFQAGISGLDSYLEAYPSGKFRSEAETLLSEALINTSDYLRAIEQMDRISNKSPRIREAYQKVAYYQAMVYYRDKRYPGAIQYLDKSMEYPVNRDLVLESHFWKGEIYAASGDLAAAIKSYDQALAMGRTTSSAYLNKSIYGLGYAYFNSQQYAKAETHFKDYTDRMRSRQDKENYDDAMLRLGDCYYVQKRFGESEQNFQQAIREGNSGIDYALFRLAVVQNFQSKNQESINNLDRLISSYPNSLYIEDALYQRGQIFMEETRYREAAAGFSELIRKRPNSPFIPYALEGRAVANFSLQNYNETIEDYRIILAQHPNSENAETALKGLQETLALQGRSGEFSDYLSEYKAANPDGGSVQNLEFEAAKSLYFEKNFQQATRAFQKFLESYPQSGQRIDALYFLGDSYYQLESYDEALRAFRQLENEPASPQRLRAMQRMGAIELDRGNFNAAIPYLETAAENARNKVEEVEALQGLLLAYLETKKYNQVISTAERLQKQSGIIPESTPNALLAKAKAQFALNRKDAAEVTLAILVDEYKTVQGAEGLYLLAESYQQSGEIEQSNESIFEMSGPFADFGYWYGKMFLLIADNYLNAGEEFQAKATLESIVENTTDDEIRQLAQDKLQSLN
ncbi:Outer membrane protein assembly factor BamD, BamD/ComL family [Algoriphagus faecimaris]|uniref:Outer membrane protein assembly factor BamD, BamD/ComL family n=1 Tax=Algoriphagus faecimaris TaxID=686796 RepID=A0A1G6VCM4_9BACT|nr:tetratricopeptide repeat protein [Algoriphagus faecimaris]SDD51261.1 Outer membrane protein assembly factor BamD, BamD/ComL family [Algoriphagus faecimaris]